MIDTISIIETGETPVDVPIHDTTYNYLVKDQEPAREFLNTLYVCDRDIVYNNPNVDITEAWLINNNAYVYKIEDDDIVSLQLNEESCSGSTFEIGAVVSQQFTAKLVNSDEFQEHCTTPVEGYDNYFENKCVIAFNRLALKYSDEYYIPVDELPTEDISTDVIYLIATDTINVWEQWQYDGEEWEKLSEDFKYDIFEPYVMQWGSVPLGVYYVYDTPKINGLFIDFVCYDKMLELERKMTFINLEYYNMVSKMKELFKIVSTSDFNRAVLNVSDSISLDTSTTYRKLLAYAGFNEHGFVEFNRYGKLHCKTYGIYIATLPSNMVITAKKETTTRDMRVVGGNIGANNNKKYINNGYAVKIDDMPLISKEKLYYADQLIEETADFLYGRFPNEYQPCEITTNGYPYLEVGDGIDVTVVETVFDENTGEYEYVDQTPFRSIINKQVITLTSGVSQIITAYDVDTSTIRISGEENGIELPYDDGFSALTFDYASIKYNTAGTKHTQVFPNRPGIVSQGTPDWRFSIFATPKTTRPSVVYPPSVSRSNNGENFVYGYSTAATTVKYSYLTSKIFSVSNPSDDLIPDLYILNNFLLGNIYEEYHDTNSGYLLIDDFIIQWGVASCAEATSYANEYYDDVNFYKEFSEEPVVVLSLLTASPTNVTGCSYGARPNDTDIKKGIRIFNCNLTDLSDGRNVGWLCIGRSKDD